MERHWIPVIFIAGLAGGWMIRDGSHSSAGVTSRSHGDRQTKVERHRETASLKQSGASSHASRWQVIGSQAVKFTDEERDAFLRNLAPADRITALEALAAQSGPEGLHYELKGMIRKILREMFVTDFDSAWTWARSVPNDATRDYMLQSLLKELVIKDPERALAAHFEILAAHPDFNSDIPFEAVSGTAMQGARQMLDLLERFPPGSAGTCGDMEFAKDFDFQLAADGFKEFSRRHVTETPVAYPINFFRAWAKEDPEAAYSSWAGEDTPFWVGRWDQLLDGIESQGTPGASAVWAAGKLADPSAPREKIIKDLTGFPPMFLLGKINSIAQAMPETGQRDRFFTDILVMNDFLEPMSQYQFAFQGLSSPRARLDAFQEISARGRTVDLAKIDEAQYQFWGFTRAQAQESIDTGKNNPVKNAGLHSH